MYRYFGFTWVQLLGFDKRVISSIHIQERQSVSSLVVAFGDYSSYQFERAMEDSMSQIGSIFVTVTPTC